MPSWCLFVIINLILKVNFYKIFWLYFLYKISEYLVFKENDLQHRNYIPSFQ